jgi:hypothetical protein
MHTFVEVPNGQTGADRSVGRFVAMPDDSAVIKPNQIASRADWVAVNVLPFRDIHLCDERHVLVVQKIDVPSQRSLGHLQVNDACDDCDDIGQKALVFFQLSSVPPSQNLKLFELREHVFHAGAKPPMKTVIGTNHSQNYLWILLKSFCALVRWPPLGRLYGANTSTTSSET